jgi:hypothetical protein
MRRNELLIIAALVTAACGTMAGSPPPAAAATKNATSISASAACIAELPGDFGHQHAGSTVDPDGNAKPDAEMVWFEVPKGHIATVTHGIRNSGWESKIVVYKDDAKSEVMRFATNLAHEIKTDTVLQPSRYYFTAWHKAGGMSMPWEPSHARLMVKTTTTYELQQDDGVAGTNKGDFDFNDFNLIITVK